MREINEKYGRETSIQNVGFWEGFPLNSYLGNFRKSLFRKGKKIISLSNSTANNNLILNDKTIVSLSLSKADPRTQIGHN